MQRDHDEIQRPIVVPFIHRYHLMFQYVKARPHVVRICTQFLEAEHFPVRPWPANSPDMSPVEHVWNALDPRVRQCSNSCQYPATSAQPLKSGTTFHRPQSTARSTLCKGDVSHCMRQMVVTPDTDWFSDPCPYFFFLKVSVANRCIAVFPVM